MSSYIHTFYFLVDLVWTKVTHRVSYGHATSQSYSSDGEKKDSQQSKTSFICVHSYIHSFTLMIFNQVGNLTIMSPYGQPRHTHSSMEQRNSPPRRVPARTVSPEEPREKEYPRLWNLMVPPPTFYLLPRRCYLPQTGS